MFRNYFIFVFHPINKKISPLDKISDIIEKIKIRIKNLFLFFTTNTIECPIYVITIIDYQCMYSALNFNNDYINTPILLYRKNHSKNPFSVALLFQYTWKHELIDRIEELDISRSQNKIWMLLMCANPQWTNVTNYNLLLLNETVKELALKLFIRFKQITHIHTLNWIHVYKYGKPRSPRPCSVAILTRLFVTNKKKKQKQRSLGRKRVE